MMWRGQRGAILLVSLLSVGCAGLPPAQIGQAAGTIAGMAIVPGVGAPVGALVGVLAGMLVQREMDQVVEQRERRELGEQLAAGPQPAAAPPASQPGEPMRVWVDETVQNGRVVAGHFDVRYLP
jgi:hypothetical protein